MASCGGGSSGDGASSLAQGFVRARKAGDAQAFCRYLDAALQRKVAAQFGTPGQPCEQALADVLGSASARRLLARERLGDVTTKGDSGSFVIDGGGTGTRWEVRRKDGKWLVTCCNPPKSVVTARNEIVATFTAPKVDAVAVATLQGRLLDAAPKAKVSMTGPGEIEVVAPESPAARAALTWLGQGGRAAFYDWEAHVLGADGRPHPQSAGVTGGQDIGRTGALPLREARRRAKGHPDALVVRAEHSSDRYYVIEDQPALTGADIKNPMVLESDSGDFGIALDFTSAGKRKWARLTRALAQRGADNHFPGQPVEAAFQHVAIVLDDAVLSTVALDYAKYPDGLDTGNGTQISGGYSPDEAQRIARLLEFPLAHPLRLAGTTVRPRAGGG